MKQKPINMTDEELRKVQLTQLELLCEVRRICEKCNIKYSIIAGTLLGAIRHNGFIPWDDDADIAMFRPEYEKFREACKKELDPSQFYFQDHITTEGYRWGYGKLRRAGTEFLRNGQEHMPYEQGIFIDIFPLDNVPDSKIRKIIHDLHCTIIRKILWSAVGCKIDSSKFLRLVYSVLSKIPLVFIFNHYKKFMTKYNNRKSKWVRILTFPTPNSSRGYLRKWYANTCDHVFEGEIFKGIKDYDEYLSFKFGDWRTLPDESGRKVHPVSKLKLRENDKP